MSWHIKHAPSISRKDEEAPSVIFDSNIRYQVTTLTAIIDKIPNELLLETCRFLCPHCCKRPRGQGVHGMLSVSRRILGSTEDEVDDQDKMSMRDVAPHSLPREQAESQDALAQMCLVSKRFNSIATPILYHCLSEGMGNYHNTIHFLSIIGSNPCLAQNVRSFCPLLCNFEQMGASHPLYPYDPFKVSREQGARWGLLPVNRSIDALLVGLAWYTKDVEEISINPHDLQLVTEDHDEDPHWGYLPKHGFPSLRTIELRADDSMKAGDLNLGTYRTWYLFDAAPRLQTLKLSKVVEIDPALQVLRNLRTIILTDCFLDHRSAKVLLARLPLIEDFEYRSAWITQVDFGQDANDLEVTPYYLACQLYRRRSTLRSICIDQSWRRDFMSRGAVRLNEQEVLPSFEDYPVLEELTVHADNVIPQRRRAPNDNDNNNDVEMGDESPEEEDSQGKPFYEEPKTKPRRTEAGLRFVGLVPPSLQKLTVLGDCPYWECLRLSDKKALGKAGDNLKKVVFGGVLGSDIFGFGSLKELERHFKDEAGVEFEDLGQLNKNALFDFLAGGLAGPDWASD